MPDSREHAEALAWLTMGLATRNQFDEAADTADAAVSAAVRSGAPEALSYAYGARAFAHRYDRERDTLEALRLARIAGDPDLVGHAAKNQSNYLRGRGRERDALELEREALRWALDDGATAAAAWCCGSLSVALANAGRLGEAADVVRTGLGMTGAFHGSPFVRLAAFCLAVRRGDLMTAELHLDRAREQVPILEERPGLRALPLLLEHLLALRRHDEAFDLIGQWLPVQARDPRMSDLMVMLAARAAGDLADRARALRDGEAVAWAQSSLERVVTVRETLPGTPWSAAGPEDLVQPAREAIYRAEVGRLAGTADAEAWVTGADMCHEADLHWEEHLATVQLARALLATNASSRAAAPLRTVHQFAVREGAAGLRAEVETLATTARIPLLDPEPVPAPPVRTSSTGPLARLTSRELEVLDHLVAGRTYAEIAAALFVSEKTISTHVSNLLHKTGTRSRLEASTLALRLADHRGKSARPSADDTGG
jgi:DNA-binding CsgD family transcriptional regulator/tetratricopeptide (TPR) repeat protein